jgi:hypothetical protein
MARAAEPPPELVEWLFTNGGPVLRYRVAIEFMAVSGRERARLLRESLSTPEVRCWLDRLGRARNIHGSRDTDAENALAKLLDYGIDRAVPAFAGRVRPLLRRPLRAWGPLVLSPFLVRAGYAGTPWVREWLTGRIEKLYQTALRGSFDLYLPPREAAAVPKAWRGKPIYRDEFGHESGYALPTSYDFYALAYCPSVPGIDNQPEKLEAIVAYLSEPRFQSSADAYGWDKTLRRCYSAGRVFLACVNPARLILFLELGSRFDAARRSAWYRDGLAVLERYRTPRGTYCFPPELLAEKTGSHIYGGSHMGLGESRRSVIGRELGSTFRMLMIRSARSRAEELAPGMP